jgi:hypothetical protein
MVTSNTTAMSRLCRPPPAFLLLADSTALIINGRYVPLVFPWQLLFSPTKLLRVVDGDDDGDDDDDKKDAEASIIENVTPRLDHHSYLQRSWLEI